MYKARMTDAYFCAEVDKFIQAAENHARIEMAQMIHCQCRTCENMRVFSDTAIIRSHVLISSFVDNYMIWNKYGEEEQPQRENSIDEIMQEPEFNTLIYCLMPLMMLAVRMKVLVVVILMVSTRVPLILAVLIIAMNLMMEIF